MGEDLNNSQIHDTALQQETGNQLGEPKVSGRKDHLSWSPLDEAHLLTHWMTGSTKQAKAIQESVIRHLGRTDKSCSLRYNKLQREGAKVTQTRKHSDNMTISEDKDLRKTFGGMSPAIKSIINFLNLMGGDPTNIQIDLLSGTILLGFKPQE